MLFACLFFAATGFWGVASAAVVINEIHYDPLDRTEHIEFVELYNSGPDAVDISSWHFTEGISFTFPAGSWIPADGYVVVAQDPAAVLAKFGVTAYGPYTGRLSNEGENVELRDAADARVDAVDYGVGFPWPTAPNGDGSSMELIHPSLDNNLGGSWRCSGYRDSTSPIPPKDLIPQQSTLWHYRKGDSEASTPMDAWRQVGFSENGTWFVGRTSIGYGDSDDNTVLSDMINQYNTVYLRHTFTIASASDIPAVMKLKIYVDDGCIVWINGTEVARFHVSAGDKAYNSTADNHEAAWEEYEISNPSVFLQTGANVMAIHALNTRIDSSDFSIDAALSDPGSDGSIFAPPTPGRRNSVWSLSAPPQIRQVDHTPRQPPAGQPIPITAKITDPDGVTSVTLWYQVVSPGNFIPAFLPLPHATLEADPLRPFDPNPAFENPANWTPLTMKDDGTGGDAVAGDSIFTAVVPGQANRTLVRYRIAAEDALGNSVRVPYLDDPSLNFACFVYDGIPAYTAQVSVKGGPYTYGADVMNSLPVYFILTRASDYNECIAYNSAYQLDGTEARRRFNWECAFVYNGKVYDHAHWRLRQTWGRYMNAGKRSMRFEFNAGNYPQFHDQYGRPYPTKWRYMNVNKMKGSAGPANWGLSEAGAARLWNMFGAAAPYTQYFHMRVVKTPDEAPAASGQYYGDFHGLFLAMEHYDSRFFDAHGLQEGNLYKFSHGETAWNQAQRYQAEFSVTDGSDYSNLFNKRDQLPEYGSDWLRYHVNLDRWYRYHVVTEGVRHFDFRPDLNWFKNRYWYFEPDPGGNPLGNMWVLPWDWDTCWGPNWNYGEDYIKQAIFGYWSESTLNYETPRKEKPELMLEYRNLMREFRDLVWTEDVIYGILDEMANKIAPFTDADRDRWKNAPAAAGSQDDGPMATRLQNQKNFAFVGGSWFNDPGGDPGDVETRASGRDAWLDKLVNSEGDGAAVPNTPSVTYTGPADYPANVLTFQSGAFNDPQGAGTFAAMQWRLGEITNPGSPLYDPVAPKIYEYPAVWQSADLTSFTTALTIPSTAAVAGHTYRARVRHKDTTGRWSHWSAPVGFTAGVPDTALDLQRFLRLTELMYDPIGGNAYEFLELHNAGTTQTIEFNGEVFTNGITFTMPAGLQIPPQGYLLLSQDTTSSFSLFRAHYGLDSSAPIAGPYSGSFRNSGEQVELSKSLNGDKLIAFEFGSGRGWWPQACGAGHSLVPLHVDTQPPDSLSYGRNWRPSACVGGSPGAPDPEPPRDVLLNEICAHTDTGLPPPADSNDWFEVLNLTTATISLSDWYVSDDKANLRKYQLSSGFASVGPNGRLSFDENHQFNNPPGSGFGLSKSGEQLYLSYLPAGDPAHLRIADAVEFKGQDNQDNGYTLGRSPDGEDWWCNTSPTRDASNSPPKDEVVISEIMYHPLPDNAALEYIELNNPSSAAANLFHPTEGPWRLAGGIDFTFPPGVSLAPEECLLVVNFDPANAAQRQAFEAVYGPVSGQLYGPFNLAGQLSNMGERVALERPQPEDVPGQGISWIIVDEAIYFDQAPWTPDADGTGLSLTRANRRGSGNDWNNWAASVPTPGSSLFVVFVSLNSATVADHGLTRNENLPFTAVFSRPVGGFSSAGIAVQNAALAGFTPNPDGKTYTFGVSPSTDGLVTLQIPAGVARALDDGTTNTISKAYSFTYDTTPPGASPPVPDKTFSTNTRVTYHWTQPVDANGVAAVVLLAGTSQDGTDVYFSGNLIGQTQITIQTPDKCAIYARLVVTDEAGNVRTTANGAPVHVDTTREPASARLPWTLFTQ